MGVMGGAPKKLVICLKHSPIISPGKKMAQLPCIGLSWPLTKPPFFGVAPSTFTMV